MYYFQEDHRFASYTWTQACTELIRHPLKEDLTIIASPIMLWKNYRALRMALFTRMLFKDSFNPLVTPDDAPPSQMDRTPMRVSLDTVDGVQAMFLTLKETLRATQSAHAFLQDLAKFRRACGNPAFPPYFYTCL